MNGWTESTLRGAASWQAFKAGTSLCEAGAATVTGSDAQGWQGSVRDGGRLQRVKVVVRSASDFDARCSCPENQASGVVCAHAVAVGLAVLRSAAKPDLPSSPRPSPPARAWEILLAPNWCDALARGKLAATLSAGGEPTEADAALTAWLAGAGGAGKSPLHLQLDGTNLASFLETLTGHPNIFIGRERKPLEVRPGGKLQLHAVTRHAASVRLVPDPDAPPRITIAGCCWELTGDTLTRIGSGIMPDDLAAPLAKLAAGHPAEITTDKFLARLEAWQEWLGLPPDSWMENLHFVAAAFTVGLTIDGTLHHLEARLSIHYPGLPPVMPDHGTIPGLPRLIDDRHCEVRDRDMERRVCGMLAHAGFDLTEPATGLWSLRGEPAVIRFLTNNLPELHRTWNVTEGERFQRAHRQIVLVEPKLEILGSGEDWLSFDLTFQSDAGDILQPADVRRLLRSGSGQGATAKGRRIIVSTEVSELIDPLFAELDLRQEGGHFTASARAGALIHELRKKLNKSLPGKAPADFCEKPPPAIHAELRPYQIHGAAWLRDRVERFGGALLADDMGLGKTLQAIVLIERVFADCDPSLEPVVLVVATTSLLGNWQAEFARFAPGRRVRVLHGAGRDAERGKTGGGEVVLTSFATLARDLAWHLRREYALVVVDEASFMRNPDTDHAKALVKLRTPRHVALTGTPVENGVRDLWSIFRFILPGWLGTRQEFRERYELPLLAGDAPPSLMERLRLKTAPFMLRRTKEQVAPELPSKLLIDEFCDLSPEQQSVYRELLNEGRKRVETIRDSGNPNAARMQVLTTLLRLRQTCCDLALLGSERFKQMTEAKRSAKLERLFELLDEAISGNHKVLVFSQFQTQLREIEDCMKQRGWDSLRLDGQSRNRQELVARFQAADGPLVFLISLKAGGYGLNLTAADTVIHFDPWWNPAAEAQATDRAHRIGQTQPVTVYRLLTRGTVEEKVLRLQGRKRSQAAIVDEAGLSDAPGWSEAEMLSVIDDLQT